MSTNTSFDNAGIQFQRTRIEHWDGVAQKRDAWQGAGTWYHRRLEEVYKFHVAPQQRILEIGCSNGDLLATLKPARGVGIDIVIAFNWPGRLLAELTSSFRDFCGIPSGDLNHTQTAQKRYNYQCSDYYGKGDCLFAISLLKV